MLDVRHSLHCCHDLMIMTTMTTTIIDSNDFIDINTWRICVNKWGLEGDIYIGLHMCSIKHTRVNI